MMITSCSTPSSDLGGELFKKSESRGYALGLFSQRSEIIPFDATAYQIISPRFDVPTAVNPSGDGIAVVHDRNSFAVESLVKGNLLARIRADTLNVSNVALAPNGTTIAFEGVVNSKTNPSLGLFYVSSGLSVPFLIRPSPLICGDLAWSPDSKELVFEDSGEIYIFSTDTKITKWVSKGHNPNWSPNGKWISVKAVDGKAFFVSIPDTSVRIIGPANVEWSMRWSPDSKYVAYTERVKFWRTGRIACSRVNVYRMSDGATETVAWTGGFECPMNDVNYRFVWISKYQDVCRECMRLKF
jgi:hypothetical protein